MTFYVHKRSIKLHVIKFTKCTQTVVTNSHSIRLQFRRSSAGRRIVRKSHTHCIGRYVDNIIYFSIIWITRFNNNLTVVLPSSSNVLLCKALTIFNKPSS